MPLDAGMPMVDASVDTSPPLSPITPSISAANRSKIAAAKSQWQGSGDVHRMLALR